MIVRIKILHVYWNVILKFFAKFEGEKYIKTLFQ